MALGDGNTWDETLPTDATVAIYIDDYNRDLRKGVRSRMALEHEWPASQSATSEGGKHKFITFQAQTAAPTITGTQIGAVYMNTSNQLVAVDSGAVETILVKSGGGLNATIQTISFTQASSTSSASNATGTYAEITGMTCSLTGSGIYMMHFCAPLEAGGAFNGRMAFIVDGTQVSEGHIAAYGAPINQAMQFYTTLTTGTHTFSVHWKGIGGTVAIPTTAGDRVFTVMQVL